MEKKKPTRPFDYSLFIVIMILLLLGNIMVLSSSGPYALSKWGNSYFYFQRQVGLSALGVVIMLFASAFDYRHYKKLAKIGFIVSVVLLALVLAIGIEENGAKRWLGVGSASFQPSEFVKIAMIIFYAYMISKDGKNMNKISKLITHYGIPMAIIGGLLYLEPHKSCLILISLTCLIIMIVGGLNKRWWVPLIIVGVVGVLGIILADDYSRARVFSFTDPWADPLGDGYQLIQSLYAIGSGGLFGKGLGNSIQKYGYIPEPHNDFIFAIIAEELGFVVSALVIVLFIILIWKGFQISMKVSDTFGSLLAFGITILIAIQVIINIAVVTGSMPVTGMPLPFFSYGGTAVLFTLADMGILLNISKHVKT